MKKYQLTSEAITVNGRTLHRIQALRDFADVKAGELGGFVESEGNLEQEVCDDDTCWVYDNACVYGDARVADDATVRDNAQVFGFAMVLNSAEVSGNAQVFDYARIDENAKIGGTAIISGIAIISGNSKIVKAKRNK